MGILLGFTSPRTERDAEWLCILWSHTRDGRTSTDDGDLEDEKWSYKGSDVCMEIGIVLMSVRCRLFAFALLALHTDIGFYSWVSILTRSIPNIVLVEAHRLI